MNLNLSTRRTFAGRYTTIGPRINIASKVDPPPKQKTDAPGAFANLPFLTTALAETGVVS
ncbi:MAG: hypothetical protein ACHP9T_04850 [Caulobacterales bacterium]